MEKTAQMNFRCNAEVKEQAEEVFGRWGLSLADALNAFMVKSVEVEGFPFELRRDPYRPVEISSSDPRVKTPKDVDGFMLWDDDDFDPEEGAIYERRVSRAG